MMKNSTKMKLNNIIFSCVLTILAFILISLPSSALSSMDNYCTKPPFISNGAQPNLLLMIDNSASMYDLAYVDNGNAPVRESSYCYDQTYDSNNNYVGYFEPKTIYSYNFGSGHFEAGGFPGSCSHQISNELCVNIVSGSPSTVDEFHAKGNYLNWLTSSKLDVQKQILTGGKYDTVSKELVPESRGCVGRGFVKEALTADYVEGGANTSLGVAFRITGPPNKYNAAGVSNGGQTSIKIYEGDYNEVLCQEAIQQINYASNPAAIRSAVEDCLSYDAHAVPGSQYCLLDPGRSCTVDSDCDNVDAKGDCSSGAKGSRTCLSPPTKVGDSCVNDKDCDELGVGVGPCVGATHSAEVNQKIVFNQSMQECWQIWSGEHTVVEEDAWNGEAPKCAEIYSGYKVCNGGDNHGNPCASGIDCTGGTCESGPDALLPGNPAMMCSSKYTGYCAKSSDDWATTEWWTPAGFSDPMDCFLSKYLEYCNDVKVPPVIDPSDAPDDTAETANIPAIIADIGVEAQLGSPIASLEANNYDTTPPTGLINDYGKYIRFGAMDFNFDGSYSECTLGAIQCPKVCSSTSDIVCNTDNDCPDAETCVSASGDKDAGEIIHYIGEGVCSVSASTCIRDDQCPNGERCEAIVGDHSTGLIKAIDDIEAKAWTPFAEAYYNAIAYFVKDATDNPVLDATKYTASAEAIKEPLAASDFDDHKNPVEYRCQANNVLIISDGASTADQHVTMMSKAVQASDLYNDTDNTDPAVCGDYYGSSYLDDLSYYAKNRNIFDPLDIDPSDNNLSQSITTYVVYTGTDASTETGECHPKTLMNDTAENGGTNLYDPKDPEDLRRSLENVFTKVSGQASSGTASSVIASSEGSGALMEQVVFYPNRKFGNSEVAWTSTLQNLWFYINPMFGGTSIREDTDGNRELNLSNDYVVKFYYDPSQDKTMVSRYSDPEGDGTMTHVPPDMEFQKLNNLWEAGMLLWDRDLIAEPRNIYVPLNSAAPLTNGTNAFDPLNVATLRPLLNTDDITRSAAENDAVATNLINYIKGKDLADYTDGTGTIKYRSRTIGIDLNDDGDTIDVVNGISEAPKVWKLGDIISSTPKISSSIPLNKYYETYGDHSYKVYTKSANYQDRGMVFTGSNDGMLHAFKLGKMEIKHQLHVKATLSGTDLGEEQWAYIPRNVTPYLKYLADPDYCHIYTVDAPSYIFDASINGNSSDTRPSDGSSWRTILIGGMGQGGSCRDIASACTDCVKTPASGNGFSSYFALDITDQNNPSLLWEFSNDKMGFATTGPAIVRINSSNMSGDPDKLTNGHWFVVLASGPTGPIDTLEDQFMGRSDQNLRIFILDLKTGNLMRTIDTGIANAFASNIMNMTFDPDFDYQDDVIHIGYTYSATSGGVLRLATKENTNPGNWVFSKVIDNIGPVTSGVGRLVNSHEQNMWLSFGSGRYFYQLRAGIDDADAQRSIYGMKEPCYTNTGYDPSCTTTISEGDLTDVTDISNIPADPHNSSFYGWRIQLDLPDASGLKAERVITDTVSSTAGAVYFTTFKPSADICGYGGKTHVWAVDYSTGGSAHHVLKGKVFVQLSTGSIEEKDLPSSFNEKDDRRTSEMDGAPPKYQGLTLLTMPKPAKKVVHMRER
jgi:type IV pilus assembly protein PilY1